MRYTLLLLPFTTAIKISYRKVGQVRLPLYISTLTVLFSIFFNYLFIFGSWGLPAMGGSGAGLGTLLARIIELLICLGFTIKISSPIKLKPHLLRGIQTSVIKSFTRRGTQIVLNELLWAMGMQVLIVIYTQRSGFNLAAYSIAQTFAGLIKVGMSGINTPIFIILGGHLGRSEFGKAQEDARKLLKFSFSMGCVLGVLVLGLSQFILPFYQVDEMTLGAARQLILVSASFSGFVYLNVAYFFIFSAGGDTRSVLILDSLFTWVVMIPAAFLLSFTGLALSLHFLAVQFLEIAKIGVARWRYQQGHWLKNLTTAS